MSEMGKTLNVGGLLDVIGILSSMRESGRLQIGVGATQGTLFFRNGKLADAHIGSLTGFHAVNAALSIRDVGWTFDASFPTPPTSFKPNERVVLKQLFGIDTVDPAETEDPIVETENEPDPEVTLIRSEAPTAGVRKTIPYRRWASPSPYRIGLALALLLLLVGVASFVLVRKLSERALPAPVVNADQKSVNASLMAANSDQTHVSAAAPASDQVNEQPSAEQNLSGNWKVTNTVEKSSYRSFANLRIGFRLAINQTGKQFTGTGEKVSENGQMLPVHSRTPIRVNGSINGDRIEATFSEAGVIRKTSGRFVWRVQAAGNGLRGTFVSTAAKTSGTSAATKEL